jgi:anti-sigma factor RsiW
MRQMLDDYLDGTLYPAERAEVERQVAGDAAMARLLAAMKQERALRAAAYASFEPSKEESGIHVSRMMDAMTGSGPAGYVGVWIRRGVAAAAAVALVAGSFAMGRVTANTPGNGQTDVANVQKAEPQVVYRVVYFADYGEKEVREFASLDEANDFVNKLDTRRSEAQVAAVDLNAPGSF